ncbi:MAG: UbiA family prenyltransferase [Phycisphaerae bacterium]|nr:UbiA family prenyltransferase [Gemmatimonadaceae bacterium]
MNASLAESQQPDSSAPPLVVDMDGTLIYSDSLLEGCMQLCRNQPFAVTGLPWWLLQGRAGFKANIANRVLLDARQLPYNQPLIEHLREQRQHRRIVLCTAADHRFAKAVADHLDLFDEVIATTDGVNLKAHNKAKALVERYGRGGFDYVGNDTPDLAVFAESRRAIAVNPSAALKRRLGDVANREDGPTGNSESLSRAHWRALRPSQWVKNLLVYVPLLAVFNKAQAPALIPATLAFLAFCMIASSVYLLNDLLDLRTDRLHPRKRSRPLAAGTLPILNGLVLIPLLLLGGFGIAATVSWPFVGVMSVYLLLTALYSFWLKRVALLDTLMLAGLYTLRILAGAAAISVVPSVWLLSFSMFLFLSLALAKRHSELMELQALESADSIPGREYRAGDLVVLISQGSASGYSAVLVLALYINSDAVRAHYRHPEVIWLICPLVLYWINKLWLNSQRREIYDEPIVWAMRNRVSRGIALLSVLLLLVARWLP